jgi:Dullard-like phosphatase family protein
MTKKINIEKNLNIEMRKKPSENSSLANTPKNLGPKKATYASNRNLTNIKISSQAVDNKDLHLEMNGKQETIINYTNQEMVDDETEYMLECFKVLLKLDKSKQPRCRSKVDFNWGNNDKRKKIALFDLDETLVHCTKGQNGINGDSVKIKLPTNKVVNVGLNIRPHWKEALELIKPYYHIVVYTASHQSYADAVLDYLDKENKYFQYRLYRNHCVQCDVDGIKFYVKDLDTLNEKYNLKDVVIIDNSVLSFAYHLNNGIPIVPYIEQKEDSQLIMLAYYLLSISHYDDLIAENKKHVNIEHFLLQVKNLEDEEEEEIEEEENKDDNNNKNEEEKNNDNNEGNKNDNAKLYEDKTKDSNKVDENKGENYDSKSCGIKIAKKIKKQSSLDSKLYGKKLTLRKSQKALEIANDMKKNMNDVYSKNYNEE